jgi:VirE N-terminal domain/Primase C terminal 1 (PriCT-1)
MITIFSKITDVENPFYKEINDTLLSFKDGSNASKIEAIRNETNKEKRNAAKSKLVSVCFSGEFSRRAAKNIIKHSGFACLDFDDLPSFEDAVCLRDSLQDNEYVYSAFISPSGNGVKAIVKIPPEIENHKKYYEALCETFDSFLDTKTKDVSRVCYESYDPDLFINENSKVWALKKEYTEVAQKTNYPKHFQIIDTSKKVDVILKWFNKKFTLNAGERNNNLFKLACSLNRAGLQSDEALSMFKNFYSAGLSDSELEAIIKSGYKFTNEFDTMILVDDNKIREASEVLKKGVQKAKREFRKEGLTDGDIDEIIDFDFEDDFLVFWDTDKNGKLSLNDYKFKLFLENRGFYKVQLNEREFTFVKVYNNIINEVNEIHIKDFVLNHVVEIDMNVYNFFARSTTKFTETYLNQLDTKELTMIRDTANKSYLFFKNKVVEVTIDSIKFIDYINVGGFVWQKNIIPHDFEISKLSSDFETFINNLSNKDTKRKLILETSMGYLLSTFKKQDEGLAIVLYDETLNDNPSGRTGKTLISKALGHVRKLVTLNGKEFDNKGNFPYDVVNLDDNIICFDDMDRTFKLETLFSIMTGNLTLKKKFLQPIEIPFVRSPKILFTSNYILSGVGDSHDDRKIEIELFRHYSKNYKPRNEFGKMFFNDWASDEWNAFFNYMIRNLQLYFKNGLLKSELKTGKTKKFIANTCEDFYDFCENEFLWKPDHFYTTKEIKDTYNDGHRELPRNMNVSWFGRWLGMYFDFKQWKREDTTNGGIRKFSVSGFEIVENDDDNGIDF